MGLLPSSVQSVTLFTTEKTGLKYFSSGTIDDGAYYFELLLPLHYVIRVDVGAGQFADVPVDLSQVTNGNGRRYDITPAFCSRNVTLAAPHKFQRFARILFQWGWRRRVSAQKPAKNILRP